MLHGVPGHLRLAGNRRRFSTFDSSLQRWYCDRQVLLSTRLETLQSSQSPISTNLLTLLRTDVSAGEICAAVESLDRAEGWPALVAEAERHHVASLLYRVLKPFQSQVQPAACQAFERSYFHTAGRNALLMQECKEVTHHVADRGIEVLVLKGAALAEHLYGDIALRRMDDLDLLVRPEQLAAARAALAEQGYEPLLAEVFPGASEQFESQVGLLRRDLATGMEYVCELHWHLLDSPFYQRTMELAWFWESATFLWPDGHAAGILGAEAGLLHLCVHQGLHHRGDCLLWACDIDRTVRRYAEQLDWDAIIARAREYRLVLPLRGVLAQTVEWLQTPMPDRVTARLASLPVDPAEAKVFAFMAGPPPGVIARFLDDLAQMPGLRARLRYLLANIFPAPAYMRQRYRVRRGELLPLYYLYRLGKGGWDGLRQLARR
jgi:hypothetical protein